MKPVDQNLYDSLKLFCQAYDEIPTIRVKEYCIFLKFWKLVLLLKCFCTCTQGRVSTLTTTTYFLLTQGTINLLSRISPLSPASLCISIIPVHSGLDCAMAYCYFTHIINVIHAYSDKSQDSQQHSQYLLFKQFKMVVLLYPICKTPD